MEMFILIPWQSILILFQDHFDPIYEYLYNHHRNLTIWLENYLRNGIAMECITHQWRSIRIYNFICTAFSLKTYIDCISYLLFVVYWWSLNWFRIGVLDRYVWFCGYIFFSLKCRHSDALESSMCFLTD